MIKRLACATSASIVLIVCLMCIPGRVNAQGFAGGGAGGELIADPFLFYYAFYLPNQQLQSLRSTPLDSINNSMVARQYYAQNDRRGLYNPISPYADQSYDPLKPFAKQGQERVARPYRFALSPSNSDGGGPALYFNRVGGYHQMKEGRGRNANMATTRAANRLTGTRTGGGGGMGGMGGMGGGMGGMGGGMGGMGGMM
jgi:hypothetical protein